MVPPTLPTMAPRSADRTTVTIALLGGLALLLTGCVTSRVEQYKEAHTGIEAGERIVILARQHHSTHEAEADFTSCVGNSLQRGRGALEVAPSDVFVDSLYPWFEPSTAPLDPRDLPELLARPGVSERISEHGVRYVVWVDGATDRVDGGGSMSCAIGPGGGGCFGLAWWETDAKYEASIWDLRETGSAGRITTDVSGRSVMPAVIIPLPFIARTQANACRGLAQQLQEFIVAEGGLSN